MSARKSDVAEQRGNNFLKALVATAQSEPRTLRAAYLSGFDYPRHARDLPFLYQSPAGLKLLFAFASEHDFSHASGLHALNRIELDSLAEAPLREVLIHIGVLYHQAYGIHEPNIPLVQLFQIVRRRAAGSTRLFVKAVVEALDLAYSCPNVPLSTVLQ